VQDNIEQDLVLREQGVEIQRSKSQIEREYNNQLVVAGRDREYLGSFHIFALAHVVRRPIIVYSDKYIRGSNNSQLSFNDIGGIYIPLGLEPKYCSR